jgi:DNA-binding IclR family transcriptional regulator
LSVRASTQSFDRAGRATDLLIRILRDQGRVSLRNQAESLGIPLSTAYRLARRLHAAGLISRLGRGSFAAGLELARLTAGVLPVQVTADTAGPHLRSLARRLGLTVHLGVIEEDMVTYLSKVHGGGPDLFTRSGTQLEAYYSAIGKVLLAALPDSQLDRYLGIGPFIALTSNTISSPEGLRKELIAVRSEGFATDAEEACENLRCIAVPVRDRHESVVAAISAARRLQSGGNLDEGAILRALRDCARRIEADL